MQVSGLNAVNENMSKSNKIEMDFELAPGKQSTSQLLLIEPEVFYANPETMETNVYQVDEHEPEGLVYGKALSEFRAFRDLLVENGVTVSTVRGDKGCPDHLFPNWVSTHEGGKLIVYPMLNDNRRAERSDEMLSVFSRFYDDVMDLSEFETQGSFLESTGSLCLDRVNRKAYAALSDRTSEEMVRLWAKRTGFEAIIFETMSHTGKPVYHTDLVMWIGTEVAAVCSECIVDTHKEEVLSQLKSNREVIELTREQLQAFCGNSLEILNKDGERMLIMSDAAFDALSDENKKTYGQFFSKLLHAPIPTIEKYGGGSARCLIMELF